MNIEKMIDRLETILKRSEYLKHMMQLPGVIEDFPKYCQFAKELSQLEDVADVYQNYKNVASNVEDAKILMHDSDPEMAEMGKMEYEDGLKEMDRLITNEAYLKNHLGLYNGYCGVALIKCLIQKDIKR